MRMFFAIMLTLVFINTSVAQEKEDPVVQQLKEIRKTLEEIRESNKNDIAKLENRIKQLETKQTKGRVEEDSPIVTNNPPNAGYGKIRVTNTYISDINVTVNGESHRIKKGDTKTIDYIPVGQFTYSVAETYDGKSLTRNLRSNETFYITVYTLPETVNYPCNNR